MGNGYLIVPNAIPKSKGVTRTGILATIISLSSHVRKMLSVHDLFK